LLQRNPARRPEASKESRPPAGPETQPEIEALKAILADLPLTEECKWGKPCFTRDGKNIVILQLLVPPGQTQAGRVMKFARAKEIAAKGFHNQELCARGDGCGKGRTQGGEEKDLRLSGPCGVDGEVREGTTVQEGL
jgi:hypothetical protein